MKTLATCKPTEFLKQTVMIRKKAEQWLKDIRFEEIRKTLPQLDVPADDASEEERKEISRKNVEKTKRQARKNISAMLDSIMEEHPEETLEILALVCFVDPKEVDDHPMEEYLEAIADMIGSRAVISFFTSLARLGVLNT